MAKVTFDVSSQDPAKSAGGDFKVPKPSVYTVVLKEVKVTKPDGKDRRLEIVSEIKSGEFKGSRFWDYISLENEAVEWKLDQFLQAVGIATGKKRKGSFDTDDIQGETIRVRSKHETYNGEVRAKVAAFLPAAEDEEDEEPDDEEVDDEPEDDEEDDTEEDDEEESDDGDEEEAEAEAEDDYDEWSVPDLRTELKERELSTKGGKVVLVKRLRADDAGESDGPFDD